MKEDLGGGKLPSDEFGENAVWWWILVDNDFAQIYKNYVSNERYRKRTIVFFLYPIQWFAQDEKKISMLVPAKSWKESQSVNRDSGETIQIQA